TEDEATMNLAVLALVDGNEAIRSRCLGQLFRRGDARVSAQFRKALESDNDELLRRAAVGLGTFKDAVSVPDLIEELTARRVKLVEVPVRTYFGQMQVVFAGPTRISISNGVSISHTPQIGVIEVGSFAGAETEKQWQNV